MIRRICTLTLVSVVMLICGAGWASAHVPGYKASVSADGSATIMTADGSVSPADVPVSLALYRLPAGCDLTWSAKCSPQHLIAWTSGKISAGHIITVLRVNVPGCEPYQLDAILGTAKQETVTWPAGSTNGIKGNIFPARGECSSSPSPTPSQTHSPTGTPTPSASVTATVPPTAPVAEHDPAPKVRAISITKLAATGASTWDLAAMVVMAGLIITAGIMAIAFATRRRRH